MASQLLGAEPVKPQPTPPPMNQSVSQVPRPVLFYCKKHGYIGRDVLPISPEAIYCGVCFREFLEKQKIEKAQEVR
jgi:hypothetical protein